MNTISFYPFRCHICHERIKYKEFVYLDSLNTLIHQNCYHSETNMLEIKDGGMFKIIKRKYDFLKK